MSEAAPVLLVATSNTGKLDEYRRLLPAEIRLLSLADVGVVLPEERGDSYEAIATTKAISAARAAGMIALGDDSGLEVDALQGQPGILSARFAGSGATDQQNTEKLLREMHAIPAEDRAATFRCAITLASPDHVLVSVEGSCRGAIAFEPSGDLGFGYDPVFLLPDGRTIAQLGPAEKDAKSHRGDAVRKLLPALMQALMLPREKGNDKHDD